MNEGSSEPTRVKISSSGDFTTALFSVLPNCCQGFYAPGYGGNVVKSRSLWGGRGAGVQGCDCNASVVISIPARGMNYYLLILIFFLLWQQDKSLPLNSSTQHVMPRKIRRKVGNGVF